MYLKNLVIDGFKSFGNSSNLKFDSQISAIVGPNGSGKSNVAEAFRFVLGEQSMKNMRGKKGTDLIFNGKNSRLNRGSVKIVFDNSNKFLDIDYKEVTLERIVFRDGINEYYINKNKVRVKDIAELLSSANIGASGHHIISQGEADKILSISPKERKSTMEEALGLKAFVMKKADAEKKLVKVYENLREVKTNLRVITPKINYLQKEVEKISRAKDLTKELKGLYGLYFEERKSIRQSFEAAKDNIENKETEKKKWEDQISQKKLEIQKWESKNKDDDNAEEIQKLRKELSDIFALKSKLQRELASSQYQIELFVKKEKEIERKISEGHNAEEIHYQKVEMVSVVLHHAWVLWASELLEAGENISEERKNSWKKYFKSYTALSKEKKNQHEKVANEILEVLGMSEASEKIEPLNREVLEKMQLEVSEIERELENLKKVEQNLNTSIAKLSSGENVADSEIKTIQIDILKIENTIGRINSDIRFENSKMATLQNNLQTFDREEAFIISKFGIEESEKIMNTRSDDDVEKERNLFEKITRIKLMLENIGQNFSSTMEEEYKELSEKKEFVVSQITDLEESSDNLEKIIISLEQKITEQFHSGLLKINTNFSEFFKTLFNGGKAGLEVVKIPLRRESEDDLQEYELGVEMKVSLPNKKITGLSMLSGGERSLVSIALLFAMSQVTPPPFIILDETDAALDEANSKRYGDMVTKLSEHSQLILITHNRETMSRAGLLWGITMAQDGITKVLSVSLEQAQKVAK